MRASNAPKFQGLAQMKNLLIRSVGLLGMISAGGISAGSAVAADLPPVYKARPAPVAADPWNGFYVGINAGGSVGRDHTLDGTPFPGLPLAADFHHSPFGGVFGAQVGWNWHVAPTWVIGAEADWQWSGQRDTVCTFACLPAGGPGTLLSITDEQSLKWFGTARARVGWVSPGDSLWYVTGGAAWGRVNQTLTLGATPGVFLGATSSTASFSNDRVGWTIGAGIETPLWDRWSLKAEYLYVNLGSVTNSFTSPLDPAALAGASVTTTSSSTIQDHIFRLGLNYRIGGDVAPMAMASAPFYAKAPMDHGPGWNGFYGGINAGLGISRNPTVDPIILGPPVPGGFPVFGADSFQHSAFGGVFGAQVGANWRVAPSWVIGAEADWQWTRQSDTACISDCLATAAPPSVLGLTDTQTLSWFGTARARFGWVAPNDTLWYVTGGAAWGHSESTLSVSTVTAPGLAVFAAGAPTSASFSHTRVGWTIGAGTEIPLWNQWSFKAEYLYIDLGSVTDSFTSAADAAQLPVTSITTSSTYSIHDHIGRVGLNYHF
jgi:outer membrane immunogenic protein